MNSTKNSIEAFRGVLHSLSLLTTIRDGAGMMRGALARAALRCYPPATRTARGAEMLDTLLEASGDEHVVFVSNVVSLVAAGLGERARASARLTAGRTIAEAAKLASIPYVCLWLTAGLVVLIERRGWHHGGALSLFAVGLLKFLAFAHCLTPTASPTSGTPTHKAR